MKTSRILAWKEEVIISNEKRKVVIINKTGLNGG